MLKILSPEHRRNCKIDRLLSWCGRIRRDAVRHGATTSVLARAAKFGRACMDFHNSDYGAGLNSFGVTPPEEAVPPADILVWLNYHASRLMEKRGVLPAGTDQ